MASSSSKQTSGSRCSNVQIKPKTMAIPFKSFEVQSESLVDFASLKRNGMDLESLITVQEMFPYFGMLNGPTYITLVKDFWARAEVYDVEATLAEEDEAMIRNPSLREKTRQEMGLDSFRQTEIRSTVMGIPITIIEEVIAKACRVAKEGIRNKRKQIPCGRLLSEIFSQSKILEILRRNNLASDQILRTKTGKMINGKTLQNMKIIKKFSPNEKDLKESTTPTKLMTDFPPIYQERNSEALAKLVADYAKESGIRMDSEAPAAVAEVPLQVRRKRTATDAGSEESGN